MSQTATAPTAPIMNDELYQKQQAEARLLVDEGSQPHYPAAMEFIIARDGVRYYSAEPTGFGPHPKKPQSILEVTPEQVNNIYYGRVGCCCGCRGTHSKDFGQCARKLKFFQKNADRVYVNSVNEDGVGDGIFCIDAGSTFDRWSGKDGPSHVHILYANEPREDQK